MLSVTIANQQDFMPLDEARVRAAVELILQDAGLKQTEVSVAVVDDTTIAELHQRYLGEAGPTDVMSFVLEQGEGYMEGEVVASAETAAVAAAGYGWSAADELLLYVIHGTLHLVGYDDTTPAARRQMRRRERAYLSRLGVQKGDCPHPRSLQGGSSGL